ncbi:CBF/Mak21 family-domain-containing protein [Protomyces lactucae-debilis]|uniref:CBF/Mak21 family-domain-containing protein n=1 Tax=Protomyces lactucae-debilis TaxID=2754530 RepID=A0A1Y2FDW8_PROLT|nr:CBF/Mak21 family-domain-containing protein [Protomyces lactucae-debilis]ORY82120.1 CBF/Mak21 family-domain-containing protein [Protomyces lactucae-debilis]
MVAKRKADSLADSGREKIVKLEAELENGQSSLNNIVHLLDLAASDDLDTLEQAQRSLYKVFKRLISLKKLEKPAGEVPTIVTWLRERYGEYTRLLLDSINHKKASVQLAAITLSLRLLKVDPLNANVGQFPVDAYGKIVRAILTASNLHESTRYTFRNDYLEPFDDLRYYFYRACEQTVQATKTRGSKLHVCRDNSIGLLSALVSFPDKDEEIVKFWLSESTTKSSLRTVSGHKKAFSEAWIAVLSFKLTEDQYKAILNMMHKRIIPRLPRPQLLMDFLTDSYDVGGATSLLALNGLFYLMQHHNLDYPKFFEKLYALFDAQTMHVRYRSRFFRMVDIFLNSTHVSAMLIASFLKRMSRLSLSAPPAAIVTILPLTYNLLKQHPSLMPLIHNPDGAAGNDPFDADETDPEKTGAMQSSLWELQSHTMHYHPNVATLAKILSEQFTKIGYNLEDFLDHSYTTMTDAEMRKRLKNQVPTATDKPAGLLSPEGILIW